MSQTLSWQVLSLPWLLRGPSRSARLLSWPPHQGERCGPPRCGTNGWKLSFSLKPTSRAYSGHHTEWNCQLGPRETKDVSPGK